MENLDKWIQDLSPEVLPHDKETSAPHVVSFVLKLLETQPSLFVFRDLSKWPEPRKSWQTYGETPIGKKLTVSISSLILEMEIEIRVSDGDLRPGEPMYNGEFGYRASVFAGEAAGSYEKSIGFGTSNPSFVFDNHDTKVVISDNWTETITNPEEIIRLLSDAKFSPSQQAAKS